MLSQSEFDSLFFQETFFIAQWKVFVNVLIAYNVMNIAALFFMELSSCFYNE